MPKSQINFRASEAVSIQIEQLQTWLEISQSEVIAQAVAGLYEKEENRRKTDLANELIRFSQQWSDKQDLTCEEIGYARAMLTVAGLMDFRLDDLPDALLDHIEASKI